MGVRRHQLPWGERLQHLRADIRVTPGTLSFHKQSPRALQSQAFTILKTRKLEPSWGRGEKETGPLSPTLPKGYTANQRQLGNQQDSPPDPGQLNTKCVHNPWWNWGELENWLLPSQGQNKNITCQLETRQNKTKTHTPKFSQGVLAWRWKRERVQLSLYNRSERREGKGRKRSKTYEQLHSPLLDTKHQSPGNWRG